MPSFTITVVLIADVAISMLIVGEICPLYSSVGVAASTIGSIDRLHLTYRYKKDDESEMECRMCPPGSHWVEHCTSSDHTPGETHCNTCGAETYASDYNVQLFCEQCTQCIGQHVLETTACQMTTNRVCSCKDGYYAEQMHSTIAPSIACYAHSVCGPGWGVKIKGTAVNDTVCEPCLNGTFSNTISAHDYCEAYTKCEAFGRHVVTPGTNTTDNECSELVVGSTNGTDFHEIPDPFVRFIKTRYGITVFLSLFVISALALSGLVWYFRKRSKNGYAKGFDIEEEASHIDESDQTDDICHKDSDQLLNETEVKKQNKNKISPVQDCKFDNPARKNLQQCTSQSPHFTHNNQNDGKSGSSTTHSPRQSDERRFLRHPSCASSGYASMSQVSSKESIATTSSRNNIPLVHGSFDRPNLVKAGKGICRQSSLDENLLTPPDPDKDIFKETFQRYRHSSVGSPVELSQETSILKRSSETPTIKKNVRFEGAHLPECEPEPTTLLGSQPEDFEKECESLCEDFMDTLADVDQVHGYYHDDDDHKVVIHVDPNTENEVKQKIEEKYPSNPHVMERIKLVAKHSKIELQSSRIRSGAPITPMTPNLERKFQANCVKSLFKEDELRYGTITGFFSDLNTNKLYALTNLHVMLGNEVFKKHEFEGKALIESMPQAEETPAANPTLKMIGRGEKLKGFRGACHYGRGIRYYVDVVAIPVDDQVRNSLSLSYPAVSLPNASPVNLAIAVEENRHFKNVEVQKIGARSHLTTGTIVNSNYYLKFTPEGGNPTIYSGMMIVKSSNPSKRFTEAGDSGALVTHCVDPSSPDRRCSAIGIHMSIDEEHEYKRKRFAASIMTRLDCALQILNQEFKLNLDLPDPKRLPPATYSSECLSNLV